MLPEVVAPEADLGETEVLLPSSSAAADTILPDSPRRVSHLEGEMASPPRQVVSRASSRLTSGKTPPPKPSTASSRQADLPAENLRNPAFGQKIVAAKPNAPPKSSTQDLAHSKGSSAPGKYSGLPPPPAEIPTAALQALRATVSSFVSSGSRDIVAASAPDLRIIEEYNKAWLAADASEIVGDLHAAGTSRSAQALHALQVAALDVTRVIDVSFLLLLSPKLNSSIHTSPRDWCLVL